MNLIWQSVRFSLELIEATYARANSTGEIKFFDVDHKSRTIREYWMHRKDAKPEISEQVPEHSGEAFNQTKLKEKAPY